MNRLICTVGLALMVACGCRTGYADVSNALAKPSKHALTLATGGKTDYTIVVADDAIESERNAASELKSYLEKVTGATFVVNDETKVPALAKTIGVGQVAVKRLGLDPNKLERDEWIIKVKGGNLYLAGGKESGTAYAVWRFLEDAVGVRWWTPYEEEVPKLETLVVGSLSSRGKPVFQSRIFHNSLPKASQAMTLDDFSKFCSTMAHGIMKVVPPSEYFEKHPEWYAEVDGKRQKFAPWTGDYCMSAEGLAAEYVDRLGKIIEEDLRASASSGEPIRYIYSMGREDGAPWCTCAKCTAYFAHSLKSDLYLAFVSKVAESIAKKYPDVLILYSAYQEAGVLPRARNVPSNVIVWYCTEAMDFSKSITDPANAGILSALKSWKGLFHQVAIWHYTRTFERYRGKYDIGGNTSSGHDWPTASVEVYPEFLRTLDRMGIRHVFFQNTDSFLMSDCTALKTWVFAKLMQNPYQDIKPLVVKFTDGYYGPAGGKIREYLELLRLQMEQTRPHEWFYADLMAQNHLTLDFCLKANDILAEAEQVAMKNAEDTRFLERTRFLRASTIDRVMVFKWNQFLRDWKMRGNDPATFPVRQFQLLERTRQAGAWQGRLAGDEKGHVAKTETWINLAKNHLMKFRDLSVPPEFAGFPAKAVYQYAAQSYAFDATGTGPSGDIPVADGVKGTAQVDLVADQTAAGGYALKIAESADELVWKSIQTWGGIDAGSARKQQLQEAQGNSYQWVKLGVHKFDTVNSGLAFEFGAKKWDFYPLDMGSGEYTVWLSIRNAKDSGALFIDRLVAVANGAR
ncbi:MAG: DUF4838 domain-containing protein [Armatimonadetes bacterium]|nr:DUF4838 domain-containing protein [Armatimonadota bacterium]